MLLKFGLRSPCMVCAFGKQRRVTSSVRGPGRVQKMWAGSGREWGSSVVYLYLPSCRALSFSASLCCFLRGIWRSLTLPSKSIVFAIYSPPILLYLLTFSCLPSLDFSSVFTLLLSSRLVFSPPRIWSHLPSNPVCTILLLSSIVPLLPELPCSSLILFPSCFLSICHFLSDSFSTIFSFFLSSPRHLPAPISSFFPYHRLIFFPSRLYPPILISPCSLIPCSLLLPFLLPLHFYTLPLLPPSSSPSHLLFIPPQPILLIISFKIRLSHSLRLPGPPLIPASHFTFHCHLI